MKILVVGGTFDTNGGRLSGLVSKFTGILMDALSGTDSTAACVNGGYYAELHDILNAAKNYDVVFWWANVPNDLPKVRNVKEVAPHALLVSSKRNDGDKYNFQELVNHSLGLKANLTFEFKKQPDGNFHMMVFDPLGSSWYEGDELYYAIYATLNRLKFLLSITRNKTYQSETAKELVMSMYFNKSEHQVDVPDEEKFVAIVKGYAETFQELLKPAKNVTRFLGNASMRAPQFRCGRGMPSFRKDGYIFVSQRNVDKQFLTLENFVPTYLEDGKVFYCGDKKPSVDTPIQLRLYEKLPNINYMIHSHCYIDGAPFTSRPVPCGAVEEVGEVTSALEKEYGTLELERYVINLIGHGSIVMSRDLEGLTGLQYKGRPLPEKMF